MVSSGCVYRCEKREWEMSRLILALGLGDEGTEMKKENISEINVSLTSQHDHNMCNGTSVFVVFGANK